MIPVHRIDEFYGKWVASLITKDGMWRDAVIEIAPPCSGVYPHKCTGKFVRYDYSSAIDSRSSVLPCNIVPGGGIRCMFPSDYHVIGVDRYYAIAISLERDPDMDDSPLVRFTAIAFNDDRHDIKIYYCFDYEFKHTQGAYKDLEGHWRHGWRTAIQRFWKKSKCNPDYAGKGDHYLGRRWRNYYYTDWELKGTTLRR
jgi:hypothetical protein